MKSVHDRARTAAGPRRDSAAGRRRSRPAPAQPDPSYPRPADVPDWSPATATLLDDLSALQRAFVEWYTAGCSAAEAYRKASGRDPGPTARNNGAQLLNKPHVRVALAAALRDRNAGARCDREWLLQKLYAIVERCDRSGRVADMNALIGAIRLMARIQGELQPLSRRRALPPPPEVETTNIRRFRERIEAIRREADAQAAANRAAKAAGDHPDAVQKPASPPAGPATADPPPPPPAPPADPSTPPCRDVVGLPSPTPPWVPPCRVSGRGRLEPPFMGVGWHVR